MHSSVSSSIQTDLPPIVSDIDPSRCKTYFMHMIKNLTIWVVEEYRAIGFSVYISHIMTVRSINCIKPRIFAIFSSNELLFPSHINIESKKLLTQTAIDWT